MEALSLNITRGCIQVFKKNVNVYLRPVLSAFLNFGPPDFNRIRQEKKGFWSLATCHTLKFKNLFGIRTEWQFVVCLLFYVDVVHDFFFYCFRWWGKHPRKWTEQTVLMMMFNIIVWRHKMMVLLICRYIWKKNNFLYNFS